MRTANEHRQQQTDVLVEIRDQIQLMRSEMRDELRALRRENKAITAQTRQLVEGR